MIIEIELLEGPNKGRPTKNGIQKNIDALNAAINGDNLSAAQQQSLMDTKSILIGIQETLPDIVYRRET